MSILNVISGSSAAMRQKSRTSPILPAIGNPTDFDYLYDSQFAFSESTQARSYSLPSKPSKATSWSTASSIDHISDTRFYRVTDVAQDNLGAGVTRSRHRYSRHDPFSKNRTKFLCVLSNGGWVAYNCNPASGSPFTKITPINGGTGGTIPGMGGDCEAIWSPSDDNEVWFTSNNGGLTFSAYNFATGATRTLFTLVGKLPAGFTGAARAWTKDEGRPSNDGRYWCLMIETDSFTHLGIVCFDIVENAVIGYYLESERPDHCSMSQLGNYMVVSYLAPTGTRSFPRDFTGSVSGGTQVHPTSEHSDLAIGPDGTTEWYIYTDYTSGSANEGWVCGRQLSGSTPIRLVHMYAAAGEATAVHISGIVSEGRHGWFAYSSYFSYADSGSTSPAPTVRREYDITAFVEIKENPRMLLVSEHYSRRYPQPGAPGTTEDDNNITYFAEPQWTTDRYGIMGAFASNWIGRAGTQELVEPDAYIQVFPSWAIPQQGQPEAVTPPSISGTATQNGVLSRTLGTYTGTPTPTVSGIWQRFPSGGSWTDLSGQTGADYTIPGGEVNGTKFRWHETAVNSKGSISVDSNEATVAALSAPANTVAPGVSPSSGDQATTFTGTYGTWTGNPVPSLAGKWQKDAGGGTWNDTGITTLSTNFSSTGNGSYRFFVTGTNTQGSATANSSSITVAGEPDASNILNFSSLSGTLESQDSDWEGLSTGYAVTSGTLRSNQDGYVDTIARINKGQGNNQAAQITRAATTTDAFASARLAINASGANDGYEARLNDTTIQLYRAGVYVDQVAHGLTISGQSQTWKITSFNGRVRIYLNGSSTPIYDYTDSSPLTGGCPGLSCYGNGDTTRMTFSEFRYS